MLNIVKPTETPEDVFLKCISLIRNPDLRNRLNACKDLVVAASEELDTKTSIIQLHTIIQENLVNGNVTSDELGKVYTYRMAKKDKPGRPYYDKILLSAPNGICPLCSHRIASTIDHHLPKALYPRLAVVPVNLIPSCKDCNTSKLHSFPTIPEEETIHPYYDNVQNDQWLSAEVINSSPPSIRFFVVHPEAWSILLFRRVEFHFNSLLLNELYSTNAAVELSQINYQLNKLNNTLGPNGVKNHLLESAESRTYSNINSWQAAMYRAISNNTWFYNGGFNAGF